MIRTTTEKKPTTSNAATTSLVGCLASPHVARRVFTRLGCFSHSSSATQSSSLPLSLSLPLSSDETTACSDFPSHEYKIHAPVLMDHLFLLDSSSSSSSFSLSLSPSLPSSIQDTSPTRGMVCLFLSFAYLYRQILFARAESDFRAPSWPMTTVRPRHTSHFSSSFLSNTLPPPLVLSLTSTRTSHVRATVARTRARTHMHHVCIYTSAARRTQQRESVPLRRR